jgi:AmmeMemoRadiSam system protein B/AmmeMemoRadiSam system protein A
MLHKIKAKKEHITVFVVFLIIFFVVFLQVTTYNGEKVVRKPVVAGTWYPGISPLLKSTVENYLANAVKAEIDGTIKALIVPHAGYAYSGQVAAQAFAQLEKNYNKVFIIGTNHAEGAYVQGISVPQYTHYKTPLGEVKVSEITKELLENELFVNEPEAHTTHIIEIELPFLQTKLTDFEVIPLVTGMLTQNQIKQAADILFNYADRDTLIVVSSDLSHYHPYDKAVQLDTSCINNIESLNLSEAAKCEACGIYAISILLELAQRKGWQVEIIDYKNSGDISGDKSGVVGYSSIVFYGGKEQLLTKYEQETLLNLARQSIEIYLTEGKKPVVDGTQLTSALKNVQGCFTTLNKHHNLRGCIGDILPEQELYKCVVNNAINAAVNDPRFSQVTYDELNNIEIEVSVLTVPEKLEFSSGEDLKNKLRPMVDGVVLRRGLFKSTYLPQVWEQLPGKESFLSSLCRKGMMASDCWQDPSTEVSTYQAFIFEE